VSELPELDPFDFELPEHAIAQRPAPVRSEARLMLLDRETGATLHHQVSDLPELLRAGDLLVRNTTAVQAARLRGNKASGGKAEALLLGLHSEARSYRALVKTKGRLRPGLKFSFRGGPSQAGQDAEITRVLAEGEVVLRFDSDADPYARGEIPIPPYIRGGHGDRDDRDRYQTHYAKAPGSVAAPTAGLHFDALLDAALARAGVSFAELVLHIGVGTFRPLRPADWSRGELHREHFELPEEACRAVAATRAADGRVVAVGTTSCRALESRVSADGALVPGAGDTTLFLRPGDDFRSVNGLLTNFHLPRSSLLLLVCAFAGRDPVLAAYREALATGYRFYSYGDAMLIL